jgi:hypothetical protein
MPRRNDARRSSVNIQMRAGFRAPLEVPGEALEQLRARLRGSALTPSDPGYGDARIVPA